MTTPKEMSTLRLLRAPAGSMLRVDPERLFLPRSPEQGLRGVEGSMGANFPFS